MNKINFLLTNPTKLVPISGETTVSVKTNGKVAMQSAAPSANPQPRKIVLSESLFGELTSSPGGKLHTVKVILPREEATRENFILEVHALYDEMILEKIETERNRE